MAESDELVCSEVHTFTTNSNRDEASTNSSEEAGTNISQEAGTNLSKFSFSNPLRKASCQQEKVSFYFSLNSISHIAETLKMAI